MSTLISENQNLISKKASIINPNINLVGIINRRGRMVNSIGHDTIEMPNDKKEMFFMKIALRNEMQHDFDEDLGAVNYCMTQRGGTKYISVPIPNGNTILAITKKETNHEDLVEGINQIIKYSQQFLGEIISKEARAERGNE